MKSLKKTLSLVLALCLVFSLMGFAGASDYKDDETIQYNEAVDVLTEIGAINGLNDGSFAPTATVTRAEAAKMVTYAVLGAKVAENLPKGTTQFADVDAANYHWATGSINYLTSKGIINGTSATTFDPNGKVTAYQLGKMLLCAAGYGVNGEFTGSNWALNTAVVANKTNVFAGVKDVDFGSPATREECAQYCFNGITAVKTVQYNKLTGKYDLRLTPLANGTEVPIKIRDEVYPNLHCTSPVNALGQPVNKWVNKGITIGKYVIEPVFTYTTDKNCKAGAYEIKVELEDYYFNDYTHKYVKPVVNGKEVTAIDAGEEVAALTGNGTVVEVYATNPADRRQITNVVAIHTELAKVKSIDAINKLVTVKTVGDEDTSTYVAMYDNDNYEALKEMEKGDFVLVNHVPDPTHTYDGVIAKIAAPKVVTGTLTKVTKDLKDDGKTEYVKSITVGDDVYELSEDNVDVRDLKAVNLNEKHEVTLYVDALGYAIYVDDITAATNYIYVAKATKTIVDGTLVNIANGLAPDGTAIALNVGKDFEPSVNTLYSYVPADATAVALLNAEYTFEPLHEGTAESDYIISDDAIKATDTLLDGTPYADDVKFIFVSVNGITVMDGVQNVEDSYKASKGVIVKNKDDELEVAAVYVAADPEVSGTELLYIVRYDGSEKVDGVKYYNYTALLEGAPIQFKTKSTADRGHFYAFSKDESTNVYKLKDYSATVANKATSVRTGDKFDKLDVGYQLSTTNSHSHSLDLANYNAKNAVIVDLTRNSISDLSDLKDLKDEHKTATLALVFDDLKTSKTYKQISYIYVREVVNDGAEPSTPEVVTGLVTGIDETHFIVDSKTAYFTTEKTVLRNAKDEVIKVGKDLRSKLDEGDKVDVKTDGTDAIEVKILKTKEELAKVAEQKVVADELAKVKDAYEVPFGTKDNTTSKAAAAKTLVVADVTDSKVAVDVTYADGKYTVLLKSKANSEVTVKKDITVSIAEASTDATVKLVKVKGIKATVDASDSTVYNVTLQKGTDLSTLAKEDIEVVANYTFAAVEDAATVDASSGVWTVKVTAEDTTTSKTYTINVTVAK